MRESPRLHESIFVTLAAKVGHASFCDALQLASHVVDCVDELGRQGSSVVQLAAETTIVG